jgi:hypothetical protein
MLLSETNLKLVTNFFMGDLKSFNKKDEDYKNLMMTYATDNNSSTLRELSTMYYLGYKSFSEKLGPDGISQQTGRIKEVKPKSISAGKKAGTSGNFNDMTPGLLQKKKDYDIICSLFNESRFVYIVEFPMSVIYKKIEKPILNAKVGKRVVCSFNYTDYAFSDELIVHYLNEEILYDSVSKKHANVLMGKYDDKLAKFFK